MWGGGSAGPDTPAASAGESRGGGKGRDALEGKVPQRRPQQRLGRRLEGVAEAVGGGYCRLQMLLKLAPAVRETLVGALEGAGGGGTSPPSNASLWGGFCFGFGAFWNFLFHSEHFEHTQDEGVQAPVTMHHNRREMGEMGGGVCAPVHRGPQTQNPPCPLKTSRHRSQRVWQSCGHSTQGPGTLPTLCRPPPKTFGRTLPIWRKAASQWEARRASACLEHWKGRRGGV